MVANDLGGMANFDVRGMVGRIYVGKHETLLQTKYISYWLHGFRKEDCLKFFSHYTSMKLIMTPGHSQFRPQGHGWQDLCGGSLDIVIY